MVCNYLASKLVQWYNESGGKLEGEFSFRFRGKESYLYLQNFPFLIKTMLQKLESNNIQQRIHEVFYQSIHLRKRISYSVRIVQFDEGILKDLSEECYSLYKLAAFSIAKLVQVSGHCVKQFLCMQRKYIMNMGLV